MTNKRCQGIELISKQCKEQVLQLGSNIKMARILRRMKQEDVAFSASISVKTYRKIEKGDTGVSIGLYLSVLDTFGLTKEFSLLANPSVDKSGIEATRDGLPERIRDKNKIKF